jgi:Cd2+/Zn2+-exporting ATPase
MDCVEEVAVLKREIGPLVGGEDHLAFDVINGRMTVLETAAPLSDAQVEVSVRRTGMRARRWVAGGEGSEAAVVPLQRRLQTTFTAASGLALGAALAVHAFESAGPGFAALFSGHPAAGMPWYEAALYLTAVLFGVRYVMPKAWFAARSLRPDMNLLMVIAVAGAIAIGEWFEAAAVSFLFALSLALESWSVQRARHAISALLDLAPPTVHVLQPNGSTQEVAAAEVAIDTRFVVRPGERIPLDGSVVTGISEVNQAPITGESVPVEKRPESELFAGTINGDGVLEVTSSRTADDTTLARIIRMVESAHGRRARVEQWVERFARVYTPAVMLLALAVFLLPPLLLGGAWDAWFYRALVLLVIACPCALVISTPVSIVASLAAAARHGVLVKGGTFLELPARLVALALDKTGTLTRGAPAVVGLEPLNGHTEDELLVRAAALEAHSTHPLARAIQTRAAERGLVVEPATEVRAVPGKGVSGHYRGEPFWLGSHRFLLERKLDDDVARSHAMRLEHDGRTVVIIGNDDHVCGLIALADTVRPESSALIRTLHQAGVKHVVMLTGDNRATAEAIAREVGIDEVHAELLPEEKVAAIEELVARYGTVAMVGDGINDAPALARASFGIAMGAAGSDAAIETADIALMTDDLSRLPWLVRHSRRTLAVIHQNIGFSLGVKALFVGLTFAGYATLWGAIAADVGTSLLVVGNALRLLRE